MTGELEGQEWLGQKSFVLWVSGQQAGELRGEIECVANSAHYRFDSSRELLQILASMLNAEADGAEPSKAPSPARPAAEDAG